jgi:hypothetical protein
MCRRKSGSFDSNGIDCEAFVSKRYFGFCSMHHHPNTAAILKQQGNAQYKEQQINHPR